MHVITAEPWRGATLEKGVEQLPVDVALEQADLTIGSQLRRGR